MFIGGAVRDDSLSQLLDQALGNSSSPTMATLKTKGMHMYPPLNYADSPYQSETERVADYITESSFTCHNRLVADAYAGRVYTVEYAVSSAKHGGDQAATFFNPLTAQNIPPDSLPDRLAYQSYFTSFARSGNPNTYRNNATIEWPLTTGFDGPMLKNVLKFEHPVGPEGFSIEDDVEEAKDRCKFWTEVQTAIQAVLDGQK
jgi:carboxylesterase type B